MIVMKYSRSKGSVSHGRIAVHRLYDCKHLELRINWVTVDRYDPDILLATVDPNNQVQELYWGERYK